MRPKVKICGITTLADARFCAGAGADYLGYIQYPPSPRFIQPQDVGAISAWIYGPASVGVFVNEDAAAVNSAADLAGFDLIQLHGEESPAFCQRINRPVIKALRVGPDTAADDLADQIARYKDVAESILLDTWHPTLKGGTGLTFNWAQANAVASLAPVMLSGGLSPDNIAEAVRTVQPWGIDMSSSLESSPGQKEFARVTGLFAALDHLVE